MSSKDGEKNGAASYHRKRCWLPLAWRAKTHFVYQRDAFPPRLG